MRLGTVIAAAMHVSDRDRIDQYSPSAYRLIGARKNEYSRLLLSPFPILSNTIPDIQHIKSFGAVFALGCFVDKSMAVQVTQTTVITIQGPEFAQRLALRAQPHGRHAGGRFLSDWVVTTRQRASARPSQRDTVRPRDHEHEHRNRQHGVDPGDFRNPRLGLGEFRFVDTWHEPHQLLLIRPEYRPDIE